MTNYDMEIRDKVMRVLIECREEREITQKDLADALGTKPTTVASWEQGKSLPSIAMLLRLSRYYNKSIGYMYGEGSADES